MALLGQPGLTLRADTSPPRAWSHANLSPRLNLSDASDPTIRAIETRYVAGRSLGMAAYPAQGKEALASLLPES